MWTFECFAHNMEPYSKIEPLIHKMFTPGVYIEVPIWKGANRRSDARILVVHVSVEKLRALIASTV